MNATPVCVPEAGDWTSEPPLTIKMVFLYDDEACRDRSLRAQEGLVDLLGPGCDLQFAWWKFSSLWHSKAARMAGEAANEAQIIIFSAHAGKDLPRGLKDWLEQLLATRGKQHKLGLVGLLETGGRVSLEPSATELHLRKIACEAHLDFLSGGSVLPCQCVRSARDNLAD